MPDITLEVMQRHLDHTSYVMFCAQDDAPTRETLLKIAEEFGCSFPEEFVAHSTAEYGGLYVAVKEELWPRPAAYAVGPFWSFLYGMFVLGFAPEIPDFMSLKAEARKFQESSGLTAIPFLKVIGDADVYCFAPDGKVMRWSHEQNQLAPEGKSFFEVLDYELAELRSRKDRKLAEMAAKPAD